MKGPECSRKLIKRSKKNHQVVGQATEKMLEKEKLTLSAEAYKYRLAAFTLSYWSLSDDELVDHQNVFWLLAIYLFF